MTVDYHKECIDELKSLFLDKAASDSTVKTWLHDFNRGRRSLKNEDREGGPICQKTLMPCVNEYRDRDREIEPTLGNIARTPGRKKDLFSLDPAQFDNRS